MELCNVQRLGPCQIPLNLLNAAQVDQGRGTQGAVPNALLGREDT